MSERQHWGILSPQLPAAQIAAIARSWEQQGMAGAFATQVYGPPWSALAAASTTTSELGLASGVALAFTRSPFETACAAMDLDRMSGGRFVLGVGPSIRSWSEGFFGAEYGKPLAHLREVIEIVRDVVAHAHTGELTGYEGTYHHHDWSEFQPSPEPVRTAIPIWVAALRRPLIRFSAQHADGLIGHPMWSSWWLQHEVGPALDAALVDAGRRRADMHVNLWHWVAPTKDIRAGVDDAKATVAFYASQSQYEEYYEAHGFGDVARRLQKATPAEGFRAAARHVPDDMAQTFVHVGDPDDIAAALDSEWEIADSMCLTAPLGAPPDRAAGYRALIADVLHRPS
jgi:probable F420-dependent oxidoreductase